MLLCCLQSGEEQGSVFSFNFISLERCFLTTPPMYCSPPSPLLHGHHALPYHAVSLWNTWENMKGSCFSVHFLSHLPATMSAPQSRRPPSPIFPSAAPITPPATRRFLRVYGRRKAGGTGRRNPDLGAHTCQWRTSWLCNHQRMPPTHCYSVFTESLLLAMHCYGAEHTLEE